MDEVDDFTMIFDSIFVIPHQKFVVWLIPENGKLAMVGEIEPCLFEGMATRCFNRRFSSAVASSRKLCLSTKYVIHQIQFSTLVLGLVVAGPLDE